MKISDIALLTVCGLEELGDHSARGVTHVLSILDPEWAEPETFTAYDSHTRITLRFHDAIEPGPGVVLPEMADVETILTFGQDVDASDGEHLLVHCHAGISRSTAAMLMMLVQSDPSQDEDDIVERLRRIRPQAWPNSRMIDFADELLARDGRLSAAVGRLYAHRLAERPELAEIMARLGRGREVAIAQRWLEAHPKDGRA
jgi:predicted protein tyrosine phosphatase